MRRDFAEFLALTAQDRRDVFETAAGRLDTLASYVEKDFWVCVVLDALFNGRPSDQPRVLFKGGTSLSKGFGLIQRFSEDIDVVVSREDLGFGQGRDPTRVEGLSNKARRGLFEDLRSSCSEYIGDGLADCLGSILGESCRIVQDADDEGQQTLLIEYPSLFSTSETDYVQPRVKLECGARSALEPTVVVSVVAYIEEEIPDLISGVGGIHMIVPERTFLEKLLILHGVYCGYRDESRLPADRHRISRHYYDVAMMSETEVGMNAVADTGLLEDVRCHNLVAFRQAWKRFEEAVPGTIGVVPQNELGRAVERDYRAMRDMILGEVPEFAWIMGRLKRLDALVNGKRKSTPVTG